LAHSREDIYGAAKVACEQAVGEGAFICRAGLIVGPEDPTAVGSLIGQHGLPGETKCLRLERRRIPFGS
jgi:hypothetical protein